MLVSSSVEEVARVGAGTAASSFSAAISRPSPALSSNPLETHFSASRKFEAGLDQVAFLDWTASSY